MGAARKSPTPTLVGPNFHVEQRRLDHRFTATLVALKVVAGPDMLRFATLDAACQRVTIGRDLTCDLSLSDASVSRTHAAVEIDESGSLWIEDLGSTNGTAIDGTLIEGRRPIVLGCSLMIGTVVLRVERMSLKELCHLKRVAERLSVADKDPLTGLISRRYLDDELPGILVRHHASEVPLSILFLDIDHFKIVNDTWGHGLGDEILRAVSRLMVMSLRDSDTSVRYGGEELIAILPNCDLDGAMRSAERLRREIQEHAWDTYVEGLTITVSIGVACAQPEETASAWIHRADAALYRAKREGRDRVCGSGVPQVGAAGVGGGRRSID